MPPELLEGCSLRRGELEGSRPRIVAVLLEVRDGLHRRPVGALSPVALAHEEGGSPQVVGGEVWTKVGTVPEDGAVLHQAVLEEHSLPGTHVLTSEDDLALRIHDPIGDRRLPRVRPIRQKPEHEEAKQDHQHHSLNPALRDKQPAPSRSCLHQPPPDDSGQGSIPTLNYHLISNITLALTITQGVWRESSATHLGACRRRFAR